MSKILLETIRPNVKLYRDSRTGIAWVEDGNTGCGHSCHPHIDASGSVRGMKSLGYWKQKDRTVRARGLIYNIDRLSISGALDEIAQAHCRCGGRHEEDAERVGRAAAERLAAERLVAERAAAQRRHRRLASARPHGLCEHEAHCLEYARNASVASCKREDGGDT